MASCLFCRIAAKEVPADIVYEDEEVLAFNDINPQAPVHILVIPRRHIAAFSDLREEDSGLLNRMVQVINRLARERGIADSGYRVVVNNGKDAQQSVMHIHWHLVGGRPFGWPPG